MPLPFGPNGTPRQVGVEIEIAGLGAREAAALLRQLRGGRVIEQDPYRFQVAGTAHGDVTVELDLRLAHPPKDAGPCRRLSARAVGLVASRLAQVELIFPPLPPERLPEIDLLVQELIGRAPGLRVDGPHLNPEVASVDPAYLVAHLRAFSQLAPAAARGNGPARRPAGSASSRPSRPPTRSLSPIPTIARTSAA